MQNIKMDEDIEKKTKGKDVKNKKAGFSEEEKKKLDEFANLSADQKKEFIKQVNTTGKISMKMAFEEMQTIEQDYSDRKQNIPIVMISMLILSRMLQQNADSVLTSDKIVKMAGNGNNLDAFANAMADNIMKIIELNDKKRREKGGEKAGE